MRLFIVVILVAAFWTCRASAQEEDNVTTATSALQDVLSNLKQSVEKLSLDNDQLAARDNAMKAQMNQLQVQLGQLEAQGDLLNKTAAPLQGNNPRRAQDIARLETENYNLDNQNQKAEAGIKLIRQSMDAGYQEDQRLLLRLKGMSNFVTPPIQAPSPESQLADRLQKEKLKLMKMIEDSQLRQESLHESIIEIQKNAPLQPAAGALAQQQLLKEQIKGMETQIAAYAQENPSGGTAGYANSWDVTQLRQLELELKYLERNYLQLKDLMEQMTKKAQTARMTVSQRIEEEKLQSSVDKLKQQGEGLKAALDDLRSQLVDLDKRKSHLETMVK